ncbi:hypothetical protein TNCT_961 [Trichonephila clavata]|uniref:Uncharacterized protein n=1 Tax=Trichonephila clavata TaxID=2740835 RepID=A0A8X6FRG1_TRICU|nr:hypothetical protein TNCT_961 [Trichonephila clavata]
MQSRVFGILQSTNTEWCRGSHYLRLPCTHKWHESPRYCQYRNLKRSPLEQCFPSTNKDFNPWVKKHRASGQTTANVLFNVPFAQHGKGLLFLCRVQKDLNQRGLQQTGKAHYVQMGALLNCFLDRLC